MKRLVPQKLEGKRLKGYVAKRGKISDWAPNHPFAHDQITFVPHQDSSSTNPSDKQNLENSASAQPDPMLPAMNGLEEWLRGEAKKYEATKPSSQEASDDTTPQLKEKD